jgi:hypothetical protein
MLEQTPIERDQVAADPLTRDGRATVVTVRFGNDACEPGKSLVDAAGLNFLSRPRIMIDHDVFDSVGNADFPGARSQSALPFGSENRVSFECRYIVEAIEA